MRIAHVVSTFPPYRGGQGNVARELAERTAARGHEVVVVTPRPMANGKWQMDNSYFVNYPLSIIHSRALARVGNAAWCPSIARTLEDLQPDVVHLHWPFIGGVAPVIAWRWLQAASRKPQAASPRRLVVQYHMDLIEGGWRGAAFAAYQKRAFPRILAAADRVVVSSLDYARHGALAPFMEQLSDRLIEIPIGVNLSRFVPRPLPPQPPLPEGRGETKKNFSPSRSEGEREGEGNNGTMEQWNNKLHVLFVGGLDRAHAFKGVDVLLDALAWLARTDGHPASPRLRRAGGSETLALRSSKSEGGDSHGFHGWRLRIVGDGDLRPEYERRTRALGIADRVEFLGAVSDAELPEIYRNADVLILPSTSRSEAFGVVLLEAMASGIPVIASDLPGVRTVVVDGETGFLVPPGDAASLSQRIRMLVGDPTLRRRMGDVARKRIEECYRWDTAVDHWQEMYQSLWHRM